MSRLDRLLTIPLVLFGLVVAGVLAALVTEVTPAELLGSIVHPETLYALRFSLLTSCAAMASATMLGVPAAYFLARHDFPGKGFMETLLDVPLVMPPLIAGVGLLFLFGQGMMGGHLARMGFHLVLSPWGAVAAQTFVATPIVLRSAQAAFASVDRGYEEAAATLGLSSLQIMVRVNLPLAARSVLSGLVMAWARTMGEFGATLMVAGATRFRTETLPIAVYLNISSGETGIAVSCSLVLLSAAFLLLLSTRLLGKPKPENHLHQRRSSWPNWN